MIARGDHRFEYHDAKSDRTQLSCHRLHSRAAIGFLVGRTREPQAGKPQRPGLRDFLIIAMLAAIAGHLANPEISIALLAATVAALFLMRGHHPERGGITTELPAIATFVLTQTGRP